MMRHIMSVLYALLIVGLMLSPVTYAATLGYQIDVLLSGVRTATGGLLAGGHVHFYEAGTTTNKDVYTNVNKTGDPAANPYTLSANGTALLYGDGLYRIVIHTAANAAAYDFDNIRYEDIGTTMTRLTTITGDNTGRISGFGIAPMILTDVTSPTAAQSYGSWNFLSANSTVLLPTAVAGMSMCIVDTGTAHDIIVDVQATDNVSLVGVEDAGGDGVTNASGSSLGDFICLISRAANKWVVTHKQGTWAAQ